VRAPVHNWRIIPHRHGQMSQLFLVESGWIDATTDNQKQRVATGDFLYIPESCVHEFIFEPGSQGGMFWFPINVIRSIAPAADQVQAALSRPFGGRVTPHLAQVTALLKDAALATSLFRTQKVLGLAHSVLSALAEHRPTQTRDDAGPSTARLMGLDALISTHRSEGWTASDYAHALSISTGHLSRLCRQAVGIGAAGGRGHAARGVPRLDAARAAPLGRDARDRAGRARPRRTVRARGAPRAARVDRRRRLRP